MTVQRFQPPPVLMLFRVILVLLLGSKALVAQDKKLPRIFLVGDSTVQNEQKGFQGWGTAFAKWVDDSRFIVENRASGGRSSRSYLREGLWEQVLRVIRPGDFILIQFGHNDAEPVDGEGGLGSLRGVGPETQEVKFQGRTETVMTFGAYLARYIVDSRARGATPILCSPVPLNSWKDGRVLRTRRDYAKWARDVARLHDVPFIDLQEIVARRYENLGRDSVSDQCFTKYDAIHTTPTGAVVTAQCVSKAIWKQQIQPLAGAMRATPRK